MALHVPLGTIQIGTPPYLRPPLPAGFVFLTDADGTFLTDEDGAYLMEPA